MPGMDPGISVFAIESSMKLKGFQASIALYRCHNSGMANRSGVTEGMSGLPVNRRNSEIRELFLR